MSHFVSPHVGAVGKLHVADIALEHLAVDPVGGWIVVIRLHVDFAVSLRHVGGQRIGIVCLEVTPHTLVVTGKQKTGDRARSRDSPSGVLPQV